jgi:error-prone DNA polymerase
VIALSGELLGFPRHLSQHVGGMVMTQGLLSELVPIENASMPDRTVIEWDKQDIDDLKILKVDLLGLGMLSCLARGLRFVNQWKDPSFSLFLTSASSVEPYSGGGLGWGSSSSDGIPPPLELHTVPHDDPAVYDMASDADTVGVFQIESRAQMSMLPRLRPQTFYDLVIEVAIVRPGPIQGDMVHPYLRRRQGLEDVHYPSEELKKVLHKTLGVPLFQEQAMRIAIECAGFSPAEADQLRRAVTGFRRYGDIDTFAQKFIGGMLQRGYKQEFAERCFAQLRGFSTYGFPESHAASFAVLVYVSCWIKRHHPAAFCAALLNSQPMGFYAPAQIVRDAQMHSVGVLPVDINHSDWDCTLERTPTLTLPLTTGRGEKGDRHARLSE